MAKNSPDMMPDFRARLPRCGHPLSHDFGFTATCAHLLPVFHTILNPGEKITLGMDYMIRTMPLAQAAMTTIDVHTEYFFVPFNLLYEPAAANLMRINDNYSSNFQTQNTGGSDLPLLHWLSLQNYVTANRATYPYGTRNDCLGRSAVRLFEMLDLNPYVADENSSSTANSGNFFPYQVLAYHAIYQYRYRLDTREQFVNYSFNWDSYFGTPLVTLTANEMLEFCKLHCRPQSGDYFNSVKVSPIVDVLNLNDSYSSFPLAQQWLSRSEYISGRNVLTSGSIGSAGGAHTNGPDYQALSPVSNIVTQFGFTGDDFPNTVSGANTVNGNDINTANIRAMFANEKLWSIIGRAKKRYDDQVFARFGYKVPHDVKHQISCFGHDISQIHIGEVISTASTTQAPLGEIAGKGYGQQSNQRHSFTAPCHGVVMMIFSITPRYRYKAGFARWNQITEVNDFYQPEFDHLGMQPMFLYELYNPSGSVPTGIFGWEYRYQQFKQRYDKVTNAFTLGGTLNAWMLQKSPWQGTSASIPNTDNYDQFMYHPADLNQIFLAQYSLAWPAAPAGYSAIMAIYDNDNFVVDSHITANLVSTMSQYSLPRLDD